MTKYELDASANAISLNSSKTVGAVASEFSTNQTRSQPFSPEYLVEWAEIVAEAYEGEPYVQVVFTPGSPMIAKATSDAGIGIGVAPRLVTDDDTEERADD